MKKQTVKKDKAKIKSPKVDIATASQVNGNLDSTNKLADFFRNRDFPYKEQSLAEYQKSLASMNMSQLQLHAIEVAQILPNVGDRGRLVRKLEENYLKKQAKFVIGSIKPMQKPLTKEAEDTIKQVLGHVVR